MVGAEAASLQALASPECHWEAASATADTFERCHAIRDSYGGVAAKEVIALAELMNKLEMQYVQMFGDTINSAIVTNVKAADLKGRPI